MDETYPLWTHVHIVKHVCLCPRNNSTKYVQRVKRIFKFRSYNAGSNLGMDKFCLDEKNVTQSPLVFGQLINDSTHSKGVVSLRK